MPETAAGAPTGAFWAIVPAGGAGSRLWPLSRRDHPKFLLDLTGSGASLLQDTVERLAPLATGGILVVTGSRHNAAVRAQLGLAEAPTAQRDAGAGSAPVRVLAEPSPRDSMPAICWAAAVVERLDPDAVVGSFAADHVIGEPALFDACVREAIAVAQTGALVTIGITPTHAATGFGYIRAGAALAVPGAPSAHAVAEFVEKPDQATAQAYLDTGEFSWNAGMFVARARVLLDLLAEYDPQAAATLRALARDPERLADLWPTITKTPVDLAIAEPAAAAGRVAVIPATFGWDDVGGFDALAALVPEQAPQTTPGLRVLGDAEVLTVDANGLVATTTDRVVALIGVHDLVVVDTPDALLILDRARAQQVKAIVDDLAAHGHTELL